MADTVYLRNMRPNRVVLQHAGLRVVLERRGSREDSVSLPAEALNESTIARWLRASMIEEITKDSFLELAARTDAYDPNYRSVEEPATQAFSRKGEGVPMAHENSATPTVIDTAKLDKKFLTPQIDYVNPPEKTDLSPQEIDVADYHRGATGRPANLGDSPNQALIGEGEKPNVLDLAGSATPPAQAKKKAPRKATTPARKSTRSKST